MNFPIASISVLILIKAMSSYQKGSESWKVLRIISRPLLGQTKMMQCMLLMLMSENEEKRDLPRNQFPNYRSFVYNVKIPEFQ